MMLSAASQGPSAQTHCLTISTLALPHHDTLRGQATLGLTTLECDPDPPGSSNSRIEVSWVCVYPGRHEALVFTLTHSSSPDSPWELGLYEMKAKAFEIQ